MKKLLFSMLLVFFMTGCAGSNVNQHSSIVNSEVGRLPHPAKSLSTYSKFEIKGMLLSDEISQMEDKAKVAHDLDGKLQAKIAPLLEEWNNKNSGAGTLIITPQLRTLRVVSPGARFFIGGLAGDSHIDMDLLIVDAKTGKEIANPRIMKTASAIGGGWSIGATDKNLLNYIADISYEYLKNNYN